MKLNLRLMKRLLEKENTVIGFVALAVFLGLLIVSMSLDKIANHMREANHLKRAELLAAGVKLD